ncbi:MAG: hypothetical protein KBD29_00205 [Candidatus Magasanikbacteria bacterium]|nr:hypothetical protein [Candidatus Magasanikbacteria bacterium]
MCFSPEASFTAAALLSVAGGAAVIKNKKIKKALPIAIIPLIFAIQQAIEGMLWLNIQGSGEYTLLFTYLFLFFALFWWPAYVPLSVYLLEDNPRRKQILVWLMGAGIMLGIALYSSFIMRPVGATVVNSCLYYDYNTSFGTLSIVVYGLTTIVAGLVSSNRNIQFLYFIFWILALVAWKLYMVNFTSVWCFFGAIVSIIICWFDFSVKPKKISITKMFSAK